MMDYVRQMQESDLLKKAFIYDAVVTANKLEDERNSLEFAIKEVNAVLKRDDVTGIVEVLLVPALHIPIVYPEAESLYFTYLQLIQDDSADGISYDGIFNSVSFVNLVAATGLAGRQADRNQIKDCLLQPDLVIQDLDMRCMDLYIDEIIAQSS